MIVLKKDIPIYDQLYIQQECVSSTRMLRPHYHFLCSVDRENGIKFLITKIISKGTCLLSFKLIEPQLHQKLLRPKTLTWRRTNGRTNGRTKGRIELKT